MTYKQISKMAKEKDIPYAKWVDGKSQWMPKHTLWLKVFEPEKVCECGECTDWNALGTGAPKEEIPLPWELKEDEAIDEMAEDEKRQRARIEEEKQEEAVKEKEEPQPIQKSLSLDSLFNQMVDEKVGASFKEQIASLEKRVTEIAAKAPSEKIIKIEVKNPVETVKLEGLVHEKFEEVLMLASQRENVLLVGPAGCGKTHLASQIAKAMSLPFSFISCSIGMSESQVLGWLLPVADGGRFSYVPASFVNRYENGGVFLLDEIDSADANMITVMNSALSNGHMAIPQRHGAPVAERHPDFTLIAAANTYGHGADRMYVGRNQLDAATLDRFSMGTVSMDYDKKLEQKTVLAEILEWGWQVRASISAHKLRRIMSTRFLQKASRMATAYPKSYTLKKVQQCYFQGWPKDELKKVEG